jgi:hypothetical protein
MEWLYSRSAVYQHNFLSAFSPKHQLLYFSRTEEFDWTDRRNGRCNFAGICRDVDKS